MRVLTCAVFILSKEAADNGRKVGLTHPALFTTIVSPSGEGMSLSYKIR